MGGKIRAASTAADTEFKMLTKTDQQFPRTSPERQGVSSEAVLQFVEAVEREIHEFHSFMLVRHGCVIAEGWWAPYRREYPHMLFSLSKSFTSTAVGLAVSEGRFRIDDAVLSFFPDEAPAEISDMLAAMEVQHLLTMTTGHETDSWAYMADETDTAWVKRFFQVPVLHMPGKHFVYDSGASYMLSAIVQKTTGMKLTDYLKPRLFEPIGIENASWQESPEGINKGGIGLSITTEDIARFGQLYLQKGVWQGKQVIPEAWIATATAAQVPNGNDAESDWTQGYGYQFWRCRYGAYRGDGVFGQYCIVLPEQDAVLAVTGGMDVFDMQQPLNLLWENLLPAMGDKPLDEASASEQRLREKLDDLKRLPVEGNVTSPTMAQVSGRTYVVDENALGIQTMTLDFSQTGCAVRITAAGHEETIACGYGRWEPGETRLLRNHWLDDTVRLTTSGAWIREDSFKMIARLYETPFYQTLVYHFALNEMLVEVQANVSLEADQAALLTAHAL